MRRSGTIWLMAAAAISLLHADSHSETAPLPVKPTGTFTSLHYHQEAGDLLGTEVRIVRTARGYQAAVQISEGSPSSLYLADATIRENQISFTLEDAEPYSGGIFTGIISSTGLTGTLRFPSGGKDAIDLKRGKSYWD